MPINLKPVDVAVIGLGAAGGVAVLPLARAGLAVAGIEAGTWMDPHSFKPDEIRNNVRGLVTTGSKVKREIPTFRTSPSAKAVQGAAHPMMNAVGGTSIHYHAQSWRFNPWDFQVRSRATKRYGASSIPAGSTLEDWPVAYDELEPYYDLVEYEVGVAGKAGNIQGTIDPRGNVFEGPRRREYPMPPLRDTDFTGLMTTAAKKLGWHPFRNPAAINSQTYGGRPGCAYHGYCDRGGCHINAKNSTAVTTIPAAQKTKHLTIFDNAQVTRILADGNGKVAGVQYIRGGKEYFQPAKVVLLASYTYENTRLLLLSKSKAYANGLANNHGQVGKHYFGHWDAQAGVGVTALFPFDLNTWYGAIAQGVVVDDWADDNFDHAGLGFIGGYSMHAYHEKHPIASAAMTTFGKAPGWGSKWKAFIHENAGRWTGAYLQGNTFPYENTYLDLDPDVRDPLGDPVCRVTSGPKPNEPQAARFVVNKMEEWFRAAGAIEVVKVVGNGPSLSTHALGGTRMGDNPETNVVDRWGFSHEAPNLGVLGGSVMGTHGARNPTLTLQALAWRTADHLVKNWKSIAGALFLAAALLASVAPAMAQARGGALPPPGGSILGPEGNPMSARREGPTGPVPKLADGHPDLSGVWFSPRATDPGKPAMLPWAAAITKERTESHSRDDPEARCLPAGVPRMNPFPWKMVQTPKLLVMLFEGNIHTYRQIFLDREHPKDLDPTWYGDSIGKWDGDTLVVDTIGFNDKFWFDFAGHPHTEQLHVIERFHRRDFGNLEMDITIEDPGAYTEPWRIKRHSPLMVGGEIQEYICNENNQDVPHIVGK